ncbi:MAG: dipeptide ABC transporter ATP-binding protein [Pseudobutyrivibrio sp.]|nr:dipeptide ABC transporter ATP-binding protein [Pseudobutyrivibrio sp.]
MAEEKYVVEVDHLKKYFPIKSGILQKEIGAVRAVDDVSFRIKEGETFGLVGESGCGKSTLGRTLLRLIEPTEGTVKINGIDMTSVKKKDLRPLRPSMQMIFQDPFSSLDPRMPVGEIIGEAVREHGIVSKSEYRDYILKVMEDCGLRPYYIDRYPHEFSGGQRQRICIARALALNPSFIVCDEPVSALDVSIQAQIINLMKDLQKERKLTYLFISHDLSVVEHISDSIGVMYLGTMMETGSKEDIFAKPLHPYTQALFSAVPVADPDHKMDRILLEGDIPSPANPPKGCKFHTRCKHCMGICSQVEPEAKDMGNGHIVKCHLYDDK